MLTTQQHSISIHTYVNPIIHVCVCYQVEELEQELTEANRRLTRIDEADKRLLGNLAIKPEASASSSATHADTKPQTAPKEPQAGPAKQ